VEITRPEEVPFPFPACGTQPLKKILKIIRVIIIFIVIYIFDIYIVFYIFYIFIILQAHVILLFIFKLLHPTLFNWSPVLFTEYFQ